MSLLYGFDLSHHNGMNAVNECVTNYPHYADFFLLKITEGKSYQDPACLKFINQVKQYNKLFGLYHFCRADNGNTPQQEAENFVKHASPFIGQCMLIADYEGESLKVGQDWLYRFCIEVYLKTGVKPFVYLQYADLKNYESIAKLNCGLWCAKWGTKPINVEPWDFMGLWQYTNRFNYKNLDANTFYGNREQFLKYCEPIEDDAKYPETTKPEGNCHCGCSCCSTRN